MEKHDLKTDNSIYIDTPFTLELKAEIKELIEKLRGYKQATKQLNRIVAHRDEVISLRDITIHRLNCELNTVLDREDNRQRQQAYNNWTKSMEGKPLI